MHFAKGLTLKDGTVCLPARLERLPGDDVQRVRVILREGKYHQVKRMIAAVGGGVVQLRRVQLGGLRLDPTLAAGTFRALTEQVLGYYLGTLAGNWGAAVGCLGFVLGVAMVVLYDRTVVKKQNLGYTITALVEAFQPRARIREEENHG